MLSLAHWRPSSLSGSLLKLKRQTAKWNPLLPQQSPDSFDIWDNITQLNKIYNHSHF